MNGEYRVGDRCGGGDIKQSLEIAVVIVIEREKIKGLSEDVEHVGHRDQIRERQRIKPVIEDCCG
jgi:hypothetical protein